MNNLFAFLPMTESQDLLGDEVALRARMEDEGYLYFAGVLDREKVRALRRAVLRTTQRLGWTEPSTIPLSQRCIVPPLREEDEDYIRGYQEVQRVQEFHELAHDETLLAIMRSVLGATTFPHPLKIARLAFPAHYEASTPPHQDFPNNQGTPDLTASWIPVCDMGEGMGGLAILRGSHRWGLLPLAGHIGAGNRCAVVPPDMAEECRWVTTDFAMGDVLLFPSLTVHAALHNASEFDLRISVDFRYQVEGQPLTAGCLEPHFGQLSWEEVYEGWDSTEHQWYWRDLDYDVVPFEQIDLVGGGGRELDRDDLAQILRYHQRVEARSSRYLSKLGRDFSRLASKSTTFNRVDEEPQV